MGCRSSLITYGESGSGKTGLTIDFAKWVESETKKKCRMYTAEPGGLGTAQRAIDSGLIDVWDISTRKFPSETIDFAANGFWPDKADLNKLVGPNDATYEEYGGFIYEGATTFGENILEELRQEGAANRIIGAEKPPQQYTSGSLRIAGANQTYYGIAQARVRKAINDSQRLPVYILWTAREAKAKDDDDPKKQFVYGPLLVGSAATPHMPAWVGACLHLQVIENKRTLYCKRHYDKGSDIPYLAQVRIDPEIDAKLPAAWEVTPDHLTFIRLYGKIRELTNNIGG